MSGMREAAMVGGQEQGSRLCVRDEGSCSSRYMSYRFADSSEQDQDGTAVPS